MWHFVYHHEPSANEACEVDVVALLRHAASHQVHCTKMFILKFKIFHIYAINSIFVLVFVSSIVPNFQ